MKKEDITALGIDDSSAQKVLALIDQEYVKSGNYIPKAKFDATLEEKKAAEEQLKQSKESLKALEGTAGDNQALKQKISELQEKQKASEDEWARKLAEMNVQNAIRADLAGTAYDPDGVLKFLDLTKVSLGSDGKLVGYREQKDELIKSKSYLFKPSNGAGQNPFPSGPADNHGDVPPTNGGGQETLAAQLGKEAANKAAKFSPDYFFKPQKKE